MNKQELIVLASAKAEKYGLETTIVCAIVEQESNWDTWAIRYEPAFFAKYIQPMVDANHIGKTEAYARATSWGLMQTMGEVAREYGFGGPFVSELCDPEIGLDIGCKYFSALLGKCANDTEKALLRWNGGGNAAYATEVLARVATYSV